ncbi:hypothetical protein CMI47_05975 [Candidatus Pacearchaeota archaeon]|jgi:UDPglucose 6-dehydrogenase|nr:hypothetical protein [Candidatus Pacearchaeota archaeon]
MKLKQKIGIVGKGFVGTAVQFGFSPNVGCDADIKIYDKDPNKSTHTLDETVNESNFIFLSVPTPANDDGSMNTTMVEEVLSNISLVNEREQESSPIILLRSTVVPGTTRRLQEKYPNLNIVFNPEFLTERSALFDFINQTRFIIGGGDSFMQQYNAEKVADLFRDRFGESISIIETNYETAELIKYMTNTFFCTKISFLNEMYQIADKCGAIWEDAVEGFVRDGRIGHSHLNVPGHDGKFGFGGSCFPKDIQAMIHFAETIGVESNVLSGAWDTNLNVRPEEDWRELKGRAVT